MVIILRKKVHTGALPMRASYDEAAGIDVCVVDIESMSDTTLYVTTGWSLEIPATHYVELHARSSLHKKGWMLANGVGIIDSDYRGPIIVALTPISPLQTPSSLIPPYGEYVVQLIVKKKEEVQWVDSTVLSETTRGNRGFGSSDLQSQL